MIGGTTVNESNHQSRGLPGGTGYRRTQYARKDGDQMTPRTSRLAIPQDASASSLDQIDPGEMFLSIVMPAHNEGRTIVSSIESLLRTAIPCPFELLVVDDGSTDNTPHLLRSIEDPRLAVYRHPSNKGKGAAVVTGFQHASGTHILVFDADSEYSPADIPNLVRPVLSGRASVVYGARLFGNHTAYGSFKYAVGNKLLTLAANILFDSCVTDLHTCLKLLPRALVGELILTEPGFGLDTEITGEILRRSIRPYEVPVSYVARSHVEGKKIGWKDGVACLRILLTVRTRGRILPETMASAKRGAPSHSDAAFLYLADLEAEPKSSASHGNGFDQSIDLADLEAEPNASPSRANGFGEPALDQAATTF
jgi:dolichol-phosphate hexosyltransferase